jgi:hypothetical protein
MPAMSVPLARRRVIARAMYLAPILLRALMRLLASERMSRSAVAPALRSARTAARLNGPG